MKIARVFPSRTNATPDDKYAFDDVPGMFLPPIDEVHVSVTFTWDIPMAEYLAEAWKAVAPVKIGGPAYGDKLGEFIPGRYVKPGYTFTSRGCPNAGMGKCWFCTEPKGPVELEIKPGHNILDPNLLATSPEQRTAASPCRAIRRVWSISGNRRRRIACAPSSNCRKPTH